jgi:hypothetical protein
MPDWMIFSGAVYQPVWNHLTGRDPGLWHQGLRRRLSRRSDTSYEAEDVVIQRVAAAFEPPLRELVEVRNQARVHLWFEKKFGADEPYPPLEDSADGPEALRGHGLLRGRADGGGRQPVGLAPFGLEDLFALRLRPNPLRVKGAGGWDRTTGSAKARWPEITVEGE